MNHWKDVFGEVPASFADRVQSTLEELEDNSVDLESIKKKARPAYRTVLIAAVVAVLLIGTALAVSVARIRLIEETQTVSHEGSEELSQELVLGFEPVGDGPIHLGVWELGAVPEGYELVDRDYMMDDNWAYGGERWENDRGEGIGFEYQAADQRSGQIMLDTADIAEKTEVSVGGSTGTLYRLTDGEQVLLWTNGERGIGYILTAPSEVDILTVAESVVQR